MLDDLDSFDDILLPTTTITERRPGKFRPRARAKTANVASTTPKNSDAAQLVPPSPQPLAQDSDFNLEMERTGHETGLSNCSGVAGGFLDSSRQSQGSLGQAADACFRLCSPNGPSSTTGNVVIFQPKVDQQCLNKELMASSNDVLGIATSLGVSTLNSSLSQPEAVHFEINTAYAEPLINLEASQGEALAEFSTIESPRYTGGTTGVRRAGKFQPENISQPNKGMAKSISFISPEAFDSVIPSVGSFLRQWIFPLYK
ncbi:hypothetical protein MUK42_37412 [Musa troglodytarum]|uniref:Uncharacterized protein n=1 Tax=Musa troglodytarum TaxID=320322 RepID=A0A9E7FSE7_9LILI|nr:hypothetical protein MUK42_37412 [Musa troglodytarum]